MEALIHRSGTTTEHESFIGEVSEITIDTTKKTIVVHDGFTVGGHPLLRASEFNEYKNNVESLSDYKTIFLEEAEN